ncbi:MAG TPA: hypothetical protein VHR17_09435 [Thermoanaerobaculia bacterium]|nr:hypothetical protein [Thermoanaerobaculia bacterium]
MVDQRTALALDEHTSFVLPSLLEFVKRPPKKIVLDLGPALGENIRRMEGCKLYISNFFESLTEGGSAAVSGKGFAASCARLLQFPDDVRFDLVLAWDLFNYLGLAEVQVLAQHLVALSRPGTRIMALVSIQKKIPERPFRFVIRDQSTLRYETLSPGQRDCPRHSEPDVLKRMAGFKVERGMLLRNGMREYSFVRDEASAADSDADRQPIVSTPPPRYT